MSNKYEVIKRNGRFEVISTLTMECQSVWTSLIQARQVARKLNSKQ